MLCPLAIEVYLSSCGFPPKAGTAVSLLLLSLKVNVPYLCDVRGLLSFIMRRLGSYEKSSTLDQVTLFTVS